MDFPFKNDVTFGFSPLKVDWNHFEDALTSYGNLTSNFS